jgi:large subunit ribosomal protein L28
MARACEVCGKTAQMGNQVETRGKAKYLGGVGTKITGISRRKFKPNLQNVKVTTQNGTNKSMRVCTRCLSKGFVRKAVKQRPFKLTTHAKPKAKV